MLGTLEIRAWGWAVFGLCLCCGLCGRGHLGIALAFFAGCVLAGFASTFAAVAAISVARAALTSFAVVFSGGAAFWVGVQAFAGDGFAFGCGVGWGRVVVGAALSLAFATIAAFTTFAASFTAALATVSSAFTGRTLLAHFGAVGVQLRRGIVAVVTAAFAAITATFAGRTVTVDALGSFGALTALSTLAAHGAGFAFTAFVAAFATATVFAGCTDFTRGVFGAFATATATATIAAFAFTPFAITAAFAGFVVFLVGWRGRGCFRGGCEQIFQPTKETAGGSHHRRGCHFGRWCGFGQHGLLVRWCLGLDDRVGRWCIRQDAFDDGCLFVGRLLRATCHGGRVFDLFGHFVAGFDAVQARVVVLEAFELVVRGFQRLVGHQQHVDALLQFDFGDLGALFVEQERRDFDGHLGVHGGAVVLHGLFLNDPQNLQCRAFSVANVACATATWAGDGGTLGQGGFEALAAHFEQAEFADGTELHAGTVLAQGVAQAVFHFAAVFALVHVDEVDHDQTAQVAQAHLAGHFVSGFQVGAGGGFFDVATFDGTGRVHVHRDQGLGVVDHDGTTRGQLHGAGIGRFDLVLDLEAAEQWRIVTVALHAGREFWHYVAHELLSLFVNVVGVDQDVADVVVEVIPDGADDQARFLINEESAFALCGTVNGGPKFEQVVQVPLQLGRCAANAGSAGNDGHAFRVFELVHGLFELGPVVALDTAADATASGVVGHEDHISASQADEGRQCCAFVAAFFFFDLDQKGLALFDDVLDACLADGHAFSKVLAGNFFEGQKAVAVFAVVDKASFQ